MARSIKLNDENYIDSTGIVHNKTLLSEILAPTVLYKNESGSNGNIKLNDSVSNYQYIEVYYRNNDQFHNSKKFYNIDGKKVVLNSFYVSNSNVVLKQQSRQFNGRQFDVLSNAEVSTTAITYIKTSSNTFVTLILGYK